jgi:hypothetical protein
MTGGTIRNNISGTNGGGVYVYNSPFTMSGGTIIDNRATNGGGVYLVYGGTTFTMRGGSIRDNIAATNGGGVYMVSSAFDMYRGSISGNKASSGGGVYKGGGTFILYGGAISGNTAEDATTAYGGGVCVDNGGFSMHGGAISGNTVKGGSLSLGGGVYVGSSGSFTKVPDGGGATSGIIYGFDSGDPNHNRVMDTSVPPVHQPGNGDAVYKVSTTQKREKTVGEDEHEPTTTNPLFWIDP